MRVVWEWFKRHERMLSMGLNLVFVGFAVSLMMDGDFKKACNYFLEGFIFFAIDFLREIIKKWLEE